ncbi:hypothetical protein, partial [Pseudovibrio flavus]|uniref:hypothetical protein n=1 Tax=Pseudovibrio flavus TaxID=2529854 RepID=UPI00211BF64E
EDGTDSLTFGIKVQDEEDIDLTADDVCVDEDADGQGVSFSLGIVADITDADGSEGDGSTPDTVTIVFDHLPPGTTTNVGDLDIDACTWTGSVDEANMLVWTVPEDYSTGGQPTNFSITVTTPEGQETVDVTVTIKPTEDIDIVAGPITATETDAPVDVKPADFITVSQSDDDGSEYIQSITFTLSGLPDGTQTNAGTITNGQLVFTGTPAEFDALCITLPTDFSTQNPGPDLTGTIQATSNE